jgi:L-ascorbate metabolism protein UlaG (beta-lactamase superfamily)
MPQTMGSMLEFMTAAGSPAYSLYISGDTLVFDQLRQVPRRYPHIDLALLHLGGTRVFGVLVTMDAKQGIQALQLLQPDTAIPIHYDDYPVFKSPLSDFMAAVDRAGLKSKVRYLKRGESYEFTPAR